MEQKAETTSKTYRNSPAHSYYEKKIVNKVCVKGGCNNKTHLNFVRCKECHEEHRENMREARKKKNAAGLCSVIGCTNERAISRNKLLKKCESCARKDRK